MGAGDDDRVRLQVRNKFCGRVKGINCGLDSFFFPMAHFRKDQGRMGNLYCAEDCHGEGSFR